MTIFKLFFYGLLMGISDLIPGFSAGTMAITLGIYDRLVETVGLFLKNLHLWKKHLFFLLPIAIGMITSILLFSAFFKFLLTYHRVVTFSVFTGILLATTKQIIQVHFFKTKISFISKSYFMILGVGILIPLSLIILYYHQAQSLSYTVSDFQFFDIKLYMVLLGVGILGAIAMILPGISGSLLLILLGFYDTIITMLQPNMIFSYLFPLAFFGIGVFLGLIIGCFLISQLIQKYPIQIVVFMIGLLIGSLLYIFCTEIIKKGFDLYDLGTFLIAMLIGYFIVNYTTSIKKLF